MDRPRKVLFAAWNMGPIQLKVLLRTNFNLISTSTSMSTQISKFAMDPLDCDTLLKGVQANLRKETGCSAQEFLQLADQLFSPPYLEDLKNSIYEFMRPKTHLMAEDIIQHVCTQLEDIKQRFGISSRTIALEGLQNSANLLNAQLSEVLCGTKAWDEFCHNLIQLVSNLHHLQRAIPMLHVINYHERTLRYERILEAHEGTFTWVFQEQLNDANISLHSWLASDKSLFWVTGKSGSGKSTFIKFVADHRETRRLLQKWAGNRELLVVSHHFDAMGTPAQKSLEGLLRSLVYGILSAKPDLFNNIPSIIWSMKTLPNTFKFGPILNCIAKDAVQANICLFIDGLDEYDGYHTELLQLIEDISRLPYTKLIVSSRPWAVFEGPLGILAEGKLSLNEANHSDINSYIEFRLQKTLPWAKTSSSESNRGYSTHFIKSVTDKAKGDFLWAVLATRLLREGTPPLIDASDQVPKTQEIPDSLFGLLEILLSSLESLPHEKAPEIFTMSRNAERCLSTEILFFHDFDYDDELYAFKEPMQFLLQDSEDIRKLQGQVQQDLDRACKGLLELVDGEVVFMHRIVSRLVHSDEFYDLLHTKVRKGFDSDLSIFKASMAWFKRTRFKSGKFIDLQPESPAVSLAYKQNLSKFHKKLGNTLPNFQHANNQIIDIYRMSKAVNIRGGFDNVCKYEVWPDVVKDMGYSDETVPWVLDTLKKLYKRWLHPYEEHLRWKRLEEHDPMEDIMDLVENLRNGFEFARRCDKKKSSIAVAWALLDNVEESLLRMTAREQFNIPDLSMARGIYRHLIIEAGIENYIGNKLSTDPGYFDNKYSQTYRSPLCSALGVAPRFLTPARLASGSIDMSLVKNLLALGHSPNKLYHGEETPWIAFVNARVPDALSNPPPRLDEIDVGLVNEVSQFMLGHGADPEAHVELLDKKLRTWKVPAWFKFLKLAPLVQHPQQDAFERIFNIMVEGVSALSNSKALLELKSRALPELKGEGETFQWIPFPLWKINADNFELPRRSDTCLSDANFVFRVFSKVLERNLDDLDTSEWSRKYLSNYFQPEYPELRRQILVFAPSNDSKTIGPATISSFTRGGDTESISYQNTTVATSIELPEGIEMQSQHGKTGYKDLEPKLGAWIDAEFDEVGSIQSIDDEIQSNTSSFARKPHTIAAERQIGDLLSRHPDVRFILDASADIMPKERLKRNIRRSLKLLYLELREETQSDIQVQIQTTRMLKGRGSRTRISERAVENEIAASLLRNDNEEEDLPLNFKKDRAKIDNWLSQIQLSSKPDEKPQQIQAFGETHDELLAASEHEISADDSSNPEEFPAVRFAEAFLINGAPFQAFLTHLSLSLFPDHLRQIMQLATWKSIELIDTPFGISIPDRLKSSIEKFTGSPWNWWPMEPPKVPLRRGAVRMNWCCHCGKAFWVDITPSQARIIEKMTSNPASFIDSHRQATHSRQSAFQRITGWFKWNAGTLLPISTSTSRDSRQSTSLVANNQAQGEEVTATQTSTSPAAVDDLRILFGVPTGFKTLHVIPIPVNQQKSKFESIARNIVVACGQDLPKANDMDYDYTPKPPLASIPPVHPHIFEAAFNSCTKGKCGNPFPFHDCYEFEETVYIKRIPKKKTPLASGVNHVPIWGLEARHCISSFHVILYHLLILVPPFALWGWWMKRHPDDIQSASVPITIVLAMISMFWSATGIVKQFRGEP
ncbi:hypothetical protein F53441_14240 [Fusarium austroafricanum]|uniref:NACHT domain-containing protein n=1 Tax=Fusarium austroafricanum TaxID=2364996 RepID=A0A8H4NH28_9HYPO|nr:hypothetical protein F53441_14240 [Fusarium austroafricanum]